jgi:hypothetical protein
LSRHHTRGPATSEMPLRKFQECLTGAGAPVWTDPKGNLVAEAQHFG